MKPVRTIPERKMRRKGSFGEKPRCSLVRRKAGTEIPVDPLSASRGAQVRGETRGKRMTVCHGQTSSSLTARTTGLP